MVKRPRVRNGPRRRLRAGTALVGNLTAKRSSVLADRAEPAVLVLSASMKNRSVVLSINGEVDIATAAQLSAALDATISSGARGLICDLSGVSFLDASGLTALLNARRRAIASDVFLDLVCMDSMPRKVIGLTGVDTLVPCHDTVARAAEA